MKVGIKKLVSGLREGEHRTSLRSLVLTYYYRVLDRQTDRLTACSYGTL